MTILAFDFVKLSLYNYHEYIRSLLTIGLHRFVWKCVGNFPSLHLIFLIRKSHNFEKNAKWYSECLLFLGSFLHQQFFFCLIRYQIIIYPHLSFCWQLNRQNRSLKRKSMMLLSHLSPGAIAEINLEDDEEEIEELHAASKVCLSSQCQTAITGTNCLIKSDFHVFIW